MLLTLGLDSQFTMVKHSKQPNTQQKKGLAVQTLSTQVETLITAMYDELPWLRARQWLVLLHFQCIPLQTVLSRLVVGATCLAGFILGLPMCLQVDPFLVHFFMSRAPVQSLLQSSQV